MPGKLTYKHKISGILGSFTALLCGALIFSKGMPDIHGLISGFAIIAPAALCAGACGYFIGKIFDKGNENSSGSGQIFK